MRIPRSQRLALTVAFVVLASGTVFFLQLSRWQRETLAEDSSGLAAADPASSLSASPAEQRVSPELAAQLAAIEARERLADEGPWAPEILAQRHSRTFEELWDAVNHATNRLARLAMFEAGDLTLGRWDLLARLPHGIEFRTSSSAGRTLAADAWRARLGELERDGWGLVQVEFRHRRFTPPTDSAPAHSVFYFCAQATNSLASTPERAELSGDLPVEWAPAPWSGGLPQVRRLDLSQLTLKRRRGEPLFTPLLTEPLTPVRNSASVDPLIVYDLDGDGTSEVLLVAKNTVFRRGPAGAFKSAPLLRHASDVLFTAVLADFDGDGAADLLGVGLSGLKLYPGSADGRFDQPPRVAWTSPERLPFPMVLTAGDVDGDGDLDVFLGQYKDPYEEGAVPSPDHDAQNGNPSYLLINQGAGRFADQTEAAGLAIRRGRRVYSASFVDLTGDDAPELVTVSDFAGVDLFENDGRGKFSEATARRLSTPYGFGMAHALADFDADGRLDLLMIGMGSPTVERLEHLGLWRDDAPEDRAKRGQLTRGNRLFLGQADGRLTETAFSEDLARSGWSWGCAAADLDNDGFPEVYIGNGLESRETVHDYDAEYWLHDRYVGHATPDPAAYLYFRAKFSRTRGRRDSYGGYEKNRLFLNQSGRHFAEVGHLAGVALEQDSRNVVADDLDGDGRVDLLVTSFEAWPDAKPVLRIFRNQLAAPDHHWIGFRLRESPSGSPLGAGIELEYAGRHAIRRIVTGDSYRSQSPNSVHFGIGSGVGVDRVKIRWRDGTLLTLEQPAIDRYHAVTKPSRNSSPAR